MKYLSILIISICSISCNKLSKIEQPTVLGTDSPFDISLLNFKENIPLLFSNVARIDGLALDSIEFRKLDYNQMLYKIESAEIYKLQVPTTPYGFIFQAYEDSVMRLDSLYFDDISVLTNMDTTFSAMYAVCEMRDRKKLNAHIRGLKNRFGKTSLELYLDHGANACTYEWQLIDRVIQVSTSHGFSFGTDTARNGKYYKIELLLVKRKDVEKLKKAHIYHFEKSEDFKKYGLEQKQIFSDDFLLYSTFSRFKNDSNGIYSIDMADTLE